LLTQNGITYHHAFDSQKSRRKEKKKTKEEVNENDDEEKEHENSSTSKNCSEVPVARNHPYSGECGRKNSGESCYSAGAPSASTSATVFQGDTAQTRQTT
jgi:hypothetical protein